LAGVGGVLAAGWAGAQESTVTVSNWELPGWRPDGYLAWVIRGGQARADSPDTAEEIEIEGLSIRMFSSGEPPVVEATIESAEATVFPREGRAAGPGFLSIR